MLVLPPNVFRPTEDDYSLPWGDRPIPPGYGGKVLALSERLRLTALGAGIGVLPPGKRPCPLHYHHFEEELFFVLEGEVTVRELAAQADRYTEYVLRPGELVAYPPGTGIAHQSHNRTDEDVRYLALSSGHAPGEVAAYPDSGKTALRGVGIGVFGATAGPHIAAANARARARETDFLGLADRPVHVQGPDRVPERVLGHGIHGRPLARLAGATEVFANVDRLDRGAVSGPLHWHTRDEELLLVLDGTPTLRQLREGVEECAQLQPGDWVVWHPADRVAHQLLAEEDPARVLVIGTDRADDVTVFEEEGRIFVRALGRSGTLEETGYFAGEDS
jgi:uncharacterized cupin superfamily protein